MWLFSLPENNYVKSNTDTCMVTNYIIEQECIPLGCVPSAAVAVGEGGLPRGVCLSRGRSVFVCPGGRSVFVCPGGRSVFVCPGGCVCPGVSAYGVCVCPEGGRCLSVQGGGRCLSVQMGVSA